MVWGIIVILCVIVGVQFVYILNFRKQITYISNVLDDVRNGNLDRRLLANEKSMLSELIYKMNDIVMRDKEKMLEKEKSEKAYKKLATSLSHDIRTPLASLIGYLEVLETNSATEAERDTFLKIAKTKAFALSEYIQALFEWLKLESGEWVYDFKEENICELIRLILADWIIRLEEHKISFYFEIPEEAVYLSIDKNAFSRIINNLLANIIKHSHATRLSLRLTNSPNEITLSITDNGVGIAEKDLPFLFDRLYKCDASRTENSSGLGLAIAKELTLALNGEIKVYSSPDKGTAFLLRFFKNMKKA